MLNSKHNEIKGFGVTPVFGPVVVCVLIPLVFGGEWITTMSNRRKRHSPEEIVRKRLLGFCGVVVVL